MILEIFCKEIMTYDILKILFDFNVISPCFCYRISNMDLDAGGPKSYGSDQIRIRNIDLKIKGLKGKRFLFGKKI